MSPGTSLLGLGRPQIALGLVGGGRDAQVAGETQHVVLPVAEDFEQVAAWVLFAAGAAGDIGQPGQHAVAEGVDERGGDVAGNRGQALIPRLVGGVDQPAQGIGDLARPDRLRVGFGGVLAVADQVLAAQLVDDAREGIVVLVAVVDDHAAGQVGEHERAEGDQGPVAQEVIGQQPGAGDQQVPLAGLGARPHPDRGLISADHVRQDDQRPDQHVRRCGSGGSAGEHRVHEPRRGPGAAQRFDQLRAAVHRDGMRGDQEHAPRLQVQPIGDGPGCPGPSRGRRLVDPPACARQGVQVMLDHPGRRERDLDLLV
jgi:hypothetical protein